VVVRVAAGWDEVVLSGQLNSRTAADVRVALHAAIDAGSGDLIVDLREVDLVDSTGLGLLVAAHRRAGRCSRRLVLRCVPPSLNRLLLLTRLDRILAIERAGHLTP
jgi:anti-anti-sigma factor